MKKLLAEDLMCDPLFCEAIRQSALAKIKETQSGKYDNLDKEEKHTTHSDIKYGCLMNYIHGDVKDQIIQFAEYMINPESLTKDGIEFDPHITLLYGFHDDISLEEIKTFCANHIRQFSYKLGKISKFENDDDVLKIEVSDDYLTEINTKLRKVFGDRITTTFPIYKAHVTIAYIKKGTYNELVGNKTFEGVEIPVKYVTYSDVNQEHTDIKIKN